MEGCEILLSLMQQLAVMVLVMGIGFVSKKTGYLSETITNAISAIAIRILLPIMLFSVMVQSATREDFIKHYPVMLFTLGMFAIMALVGRLASKLFKFQGKMRNLYTSMFFCDNAGFIGLALILSIFGNNESVIVTSMMYFVVDILLVWSLGYYLITGGSDGGKFEIRKIFSPASIGLILGIVWVLVGLPTKSFLLTGLKELGDGGRYLAMLYLGCALTGLSLKKVLTSPSVYLLTLVRMFIIPVACYAAALGLGIMTSEEAAGYVIMIGTPLMASYPMITHDSNNHEDFAVQCTLLTTAICPVSILAVSWITQRIFPS
jgi:predicted permease